MTRRPHRTPLLIILLAVLGSFTQAAHALQDEQTQQIAPPEIDRQAVSARIAELALREADSTLQSTGAVELSLLRESLAFIEQGLASQATTDRFISDSRSAPEQLSQIDDYLATPADELVEHTPDDATLDELATRIEAARVRRQSEQELREKVDADESHRDARRTAIPSERGRIVERLDALSASLSAGANPDDPAELVQARVLHARSEQFAQRAALRLLDEELRNYDARRTLLEKRRVYRDRRVAIEAQNISLLQELISDQQITIALEAEREAERQRRQAAAAHPLVQAILDKNQDIAARNTELLRLTATDAAALAEAESVLSEWRTAFAKSESRVERVGLTNSIGQHLRNQRARIPEPGIFRERMAVRDDLIGDLVNESEDTGLELEDLLDLDDATDREVELFPDQLPSGADALQDLRLAARDALLDQRNHLTSLSTSINSYLDVTLLELQNTERETYRLLREYAEYIDGRVLWTRSADLPQPSDLQIGREAIAWGLDAGSWRTVAVRVWQDAGSHIWIYGLCVPLLLALLLIQPWLRRWLRNLSDRTSRFATDRFSLTALALFHTALIAAAIPMVLAFVAWRLSIAASSDALTRGLGIGLFRAAELLFVIQLVQTICKPHGVGDTHFRWAPQTLNIVRKQLRWFLPVTLPLTFIVGLTAAKDNYHDALGRAAFVVMMSALAIFLQRLLRPSGRVMKPILSESRGGWLDRLRYVWFPTIVIAPLAIALIAIVGYFYSAVQLEQRLLDTAWLLLAVVVGRSCMLRGLFLAQRRLHIEQRRKKLAALAEAESEQAGTPPSAEHATHAAVSPQAISEAEEVDVAALSAQTKQLLNASVAFAIIIGLTLVWLETLPALGFLQEIEIWTPAAESVAQNTPAVSEPEATVTADSGPAITLGHVIYSIVILLITALVSKNIPGLLEIVLLQRLPISPSSRYAVTTIARYALVIIGTAMAFGALGIGWSKVQWLVAAMTVGLGFGLQEIFANFVSGLIILFERPVRVGDTVTVGGITGTVARLRIRATTIVDWDRKELIIPNKEFVTGQIVNWTLSDPILRLSIPVGLAYGSDTKLAESILLRVAKDDPVVLDEPSSSVVFERFGDSSLNFKLRVFIPHIDDLFRVQHRLHNSIDQAFREAGLVIAFPQLDVHVQRPAGDPGT